MRVLVTGGAGYIGSILCRMLLERGYDVTCLDRFFFGFDPIREIEDRIKVVKDDVRWFNPDILGGIDAVIDMAALSNDPSGELDPQKTLEINYRGRVRVAKLSKKFGVKKYILASSCSVYGSQEGMLTEDSQLNPLTTYAKANMLAEKEVLPLADKTFSVTILRQATVYGYSPRMRFDLAINGMVLGFFKNGKVPIMRDGTQWRPFVHIKDTSNAFIKVLEAENELVNGQIFNVGSDEQNFQIFNLARLVAESIGLPFNYEWYGSPDRRNYRVSFQKIRKTLGFEPRYSPREGAKEIFDALKDGRLNPDDPRTITVKWYKQLMEMHKLIKDIEINGMIL
ncbi:NAD-dependent epimerase/dehydratase family protein [Candidatus Methanodesulfokora washburnensis]|jgi:nucleoside-diphosphate-sugar epimerase|uniref:NAD(P)-dependent oxidoreductase n=1 Tax=Candidatus Methanodesulfokora washburnensis TaxID=2478471 RepID=A0A429GUT3_9CREN|nr:NAD(P)-dependent oxidoreductase [Candidatus Methanodesulfokores washburnensis]RSN77487.1 NAD(P)-dependent oxidoreductase [Candidatus Methanodesulfokores washburnensis]